ncbi:MAG: hypothetical protein WBV93_04825, partial [Anaerobacillus sp.]
SEEGYDPDYGARPLRRALQRHVEDRLSEELLRGNIEKGQRVKIDYSNDDFVVETLSEATSS